jgi:hypothetical protein
MKHEKLFWSMPLVLTALGFIWMVLTGYSDSIWVIIREQLIFLWKAYIGFMLIYIMLSNDRARKRRQLRH